MAFSTDICIYEPLNPIEHRKAVAAMCAKSGKVEVLKEALRVLNGHEERFSELLQELEEHLYLCFHTINISRRLVLAQTTEPSSWLFDSVGSSK